MATSTTLEELSYRQYILNEMVLLKKEIIKCCCCNVLINSNDRNLVIDHLDSEAHKHHINMLSDVDINISEDQCKKMFENCMVILLKSASSLVEKKKFFTSACYHCTKIITDGINGVNQHLDSKQHCKTSSTTSKLLCPICNVNTSVMKDHVETTFHKTVKENNDYYKLSDKIVLTIQDDILLKRIPSTVKSIKEYISILIKFIKEEEKCQQAYTKSCVMHDLTVHWEGEVGPNEQPLANFVPSFSDDRHFKLNLGDELVINLSKYRSWNMSGRIIQIPSFENDNVIVKLTNGTGVKKDIIYPYKIYIKWRETVYWRMKNAVLQLRRIDRDQYKFLYKALFNDDYNDDDNDDEEQNKFDEMDVKVPSFHAKPPNALQLKCIRMALKERICIIQGPPGTGKTETCVNIIFNIIRQQPKVKILVCAQSNAAVDLLTIKLEEIHVDLIRYFSSRYEVIDSPLKRLGILEKTFKQNESLRPKYEDYLNKKLNDQEMMEYGCHFYEATVRAWDTANVVCCTCITAGAEEFKDHFFDIVLIDEAAQVVEPETLVPVTMHGAKKVILVGDHKQLGPTVLSDKAKEAGFAISLFERLIKNGIPNLMLNVQYRMHPIIAEFPSRTFYDGLLKNGVRAVDRLLPLKWLDPKDNAIIMINVIGIETSVGTSFANEKEAEILINVIKSLILNNIKAKEISVISPYDGQRRLLQKLLKAELDLELKKMFATVVIANVDAFQGQENEIIILSCVRSNYSMKESIGFLKEPTRMNVALTRAKRKLIIIGNVGTLSNSKVYKNLIDYIKLKGTLIEENSLCSLTKNLKL